ncbi:MAG: hypothetical protein M3220_12075 [Chloroflexota bacterium]|nr:hypothetical protein [Chloroflexota bacterium]
MKQENQPVLLPPYATRPPHGAVAEQLARRVAAALPKTLVRLWAERGRGVLIIDDDEPPRFQPGHFFWRHVQGWGAIYLPPNCEPSVLWEMVSIWLDYFAGSFGGVQRLTEGYGATHALDEAATHLAKTLALGYATDYFGTDDPTLLLPRAIAAYQLDQHTFSAADPMLTKWLRGTLFDEGFWRKVACEA